MGRNRRNRKVCGILILLAVLLEAGGGLRKEPVTQTLYVGKKAAEGGEAMGRADGESEERDAEDGPRVALTFDDGPHPVYTARLLDGLARRGVKATFFLIGRNAEQYPGLVERLAKEGHLLGNHTYSHVQLTAVGQEEAREELLRTSEVVEAITGEHLEYVRPPFGNWDERLDCGIPMLPILWSVDSRDWTTSNVSEIVHRVVTQTKEDDIILMHDWYASSVDAALLIIDQLRAKGYEFVTADELIVN